MHNNALASSRNHAPCPPCPVERLSSPKRSPLPALPRGETVFPETSPWCQKDWGSLTYRVGFTPFIGRTTQPVLVSPGGSGGLGQPGVIPPGRARGVCVVLGDFLQPVFLTVSLCRGNIRTTLLCFGLPLTLLCLAGDSCHLLKLSEPQFPCL